MTEDLSEILTIEEFGNFCKDNNNFCRSYGLYPQCVNCTGYSSELICSNYESNNTLEILKEFETKHNTHLEKL